MPENDGPSPLLDQFKRGDVPRELREQAALGALALRPADQLTLLSWLSDDKDAGVAQVAEQTLTRLAPAATRAALARPGVGEAVRAFFAARGLEADAAAGAEAESPLLPEHADAADEPAEREKGPTELSMLPVVEKMKYAIKGTREQRGTLIRDSNKMVAMAVLGSPKLTITEVEAFARMGNVAEDVLRIIGATRAYLKSYAVIAALAKNPKTPVGLALTLIPRLVERDIKMLSVDRNVSEGVRISARKFLQTGAARRR
jgi:hypothetical protein